MTGEGARAPRVVAIHPERVADPQVVRWVMPAGSLPVGRVVSAPGRLGELLSEATLSDALVEHRAVWLRLRDGLSWRTEGRRVQAALSAALAEPAGWTVDPAPGEVLERVITDLLDGSTGDFVRSHGGVVSARRAGSAVQIDLGGACEHCPAAEHTLRMRLLSELRRRCPDVEEVADAGTGLTLRLVTGTTS